MIFSLFLFRKFIYNLFEVSIFQILFDKINFNLNKGDKVVLYSKDTRATTAFYEILNNNIKSNNGRFDWGITTSQSYLPLDNSSFFNNKLEEDNFEKNFSHYYDFDGNSQLVGGLLDDAFDEIIERITQDIFNASVAKW